MSCFFKVVGVSFGVKTMLFSSTRVVMVFVSVLFLMMRCLRYTKCDACYHRGVRHFFPEVPHFESLTPSPLETCFGKQFYLKLV